MTKRQKQLRRINKNILSAYEYDAEKGKYTLVTVKDFIPILDRLKSEDTVAFNTIMYLIEQYRSLQLLNMTQRKTILELQKWKRKIDKSNNVKGGSNE